MSKLFYRLVPGILITTVLFLYSFPLTSNAQNNTTGNSAFSGSAATGATGGASTGSTGGNTGGTTGQNGSTVGAGANSEPRIPTSFVYIPGQGDVPVYGNDNDPNSATAQRSADAYERYERGQLGSCIGGILGQVVARAISGAVGRVESLFKVATYDTQTQATAGASVMGVPVSISWDSVAYCFINTIITYIADSTIAWINSGFNGNPAFLRDPASYFKNLADMEAGAFVQTLAKDSLGINACQPIRIEVATGVAGAYGRGGAGSATQCTLSKIVQTQQGFNAFVSGQPGVATWNNFRDVTQNPQNNPNGLYLLSTDIIGLSVQQKSNTIKFDLTANGGFLSYRDCKDIKVKDASGKETTKKDCQVVTPGKTIADTASKMTGLGTDRLVLAQKFDQVVTALVAQLIKTALNKAFQK